MDIYAYKQVLGGHFKDNELLKPIARKDLIFDKIRSDSHGWVRKHNVERWVNLNATWFSRRDTEELWEYLDSRNEGKIHIKDLDEYIVDDYDLHRSLQDLMKKVKRNPDDDIGGKRRGAQQDFRDAQGRFGWRGRSRSRTPTGSSLLPERSLDDSSRRKFSSPRSKRGS
jgi:hypothetical protein